MELCTMDGNFQPNTVIDTFDSVIWTERYSSSGDVSLVVDPTDANVALLAPGTFLSLEGSQEVMLLETLSIEGDQLKVTGNTLDNFLKYRIMGMGYEDVGTHLYNSFGRSLDVAKPGVIMCKAVEDVCINDIMWTIWNDVPGSQPLYGIPGQNIPNLSIGAMENTVGNNIGILSDLRPLYDWLEEIALANNLGFSLYLSSHSAPSTYSLKFMTWVGTDLSDSIVFSSNNDTLQNIKYFDTIVDHFNYIFGRSMYGNNWKEAYAYVHSNSAEWTSAGLGFGRRFTTVSDQSSIATGDATVPVIVNTITPKLQALTDGILANEAARKTVIDGEIAPTNSFVFGTDYKLGDIVGLQAYGITQKARITEYIRSQDAEGEKSYPTVVKV